MRLVLGVGHAAVADLEHVRVVPGARMRGLVERRILVDDRLQAVPVVADVAGGAPEVADVARPCRRLVYAPFADAVDDVPTGCRERVAHRGVALDVLLLRGAPRVVAVVVLEVVDTPVGEGLCVDLLVAEASGITCAGGGAGVLIDAELETERVNV